MIEIKSNANFCFKLKAGTRYFSIGETYQLDDKDLEKAQSMEKMKLATMSNKAFFPKTSENENLQAAATDKDGKKEGKKRGRPAKK